MPQRSRYFWKRSGLYLKTAATVTGYIFTLASALVVVMVIVLLARQVTQHSIQIEPISTPKSLSDSGYTSTVAAQRLRDAVDKIVRNAQWHMRSQSVTLTGEELDVVVPGVGASVDTLANSILALFHIPTRRTITGDIVQHQDRLWLTLRMDQLPLFATQKGVPQNLPDELFNEAARQVLIESHQPFFVAAAYYPRNRIAAMDEVNAIIRDYPESDENAVWAYVLRGSLSEDRGLNSQAIAAFRTALRFDPQNVDAHDRLGMALDRIGQYDTAIAEYRTALWFDPTATYAHYNIWDTLIEQGHEKEAATEIGDVIRDSRWQIRTVPSSIEDHEDLGAALQGENDYVGATDEFRYLARIDPDNTFVYASLGMALSSEGKLNEAIADYRAALKIDRDDSFADELLGNALAAEGRRTEALAAYRRALDINPGDPYAYLFLAVMPLNRRQGNDAVALIDEAISINPNLSLAHDMLGNAFYYEHMYRRAIREYSSAMGLKDNYGRAYCNRGLALYREKKYTSAIIDGETAVRLMPLDADCHRFLSWALQDGGRTAEALKEKREADWLGHRHKKSPQSGNTRKES
jgi:tetratricopeptide (TPR) repeat protein